MEDILDDARLHQLHRAVRGFIYKEYDGRGELAGPGNVLHRASCRHVRPMSVEMHQRDGSNKKFSPDLRTAVMWLDSTVSHEYLKWHRCPNCLGQD